MKRAWALVGVVIAGALVFASRATGEWTTASVGPIAPRLVADAQIVATNGVRTVVSSEGGKVVKVLAREGAAVATDELLAELEGKKPDGDAITVAVKAPAAGVVLAKRVTAGDVAAPQTPLFEIADTSATQIRVEVDEAFADKLAVGQAVQVKRVGDPDARPAVIARVGARLEPRTIAADDPSRGRDGGFVRAAWATWKGEAPAWALLGRRLDAEVQLAPARDVTRVPRCAIAYRDGADVVDVRFGLWTRASRVTVGDANAAWVEVKGLPAGTSVLCH